MPASAYEWLAVAPEPLAVPSPHVQAYPEIVSPWGAVDALPFTATSSKVALVVKEATGLALETVTAWVAAVLVAPWLSVTVSVTL